MPRFIDNGDNTITDTKPTLDLDRPPKGLRTNTGIPARVVGKVNIMGSYNYIVALQNPHSPSGYETVVYARQDGVLDNTGCSSQFLVAGPVKKVGMTHNAIRKIESGKTPQHPEP